MRKVFTMLLMVSPFIASADAVHWGGATISSGVTPHGPGAEILWESPYIDDYTPEMPFYYVQLWMSVSESGGYTSIKGINHVLAYPITFVKMDVGETVNLLTTFYADEVFYAFGWKPGEDETTANHRNGGDYAIDIPSYGADNIFLGFGTEGATYTERLWLYGWLEVAVNGTELSIVNSAIGINGQPMVVGAIPEPSCAALLLLGLAPLALRRRICQDSTHIIRQGSDQ